MKNPAIYLILTVLLLGCNKKDQPNSPQPTGPQSNQVIAAILTKLPKKLPADDPSLPDRPVFGDSATNRQYPFSSSSSASDEVRLQKILFKGRLQQEYFYNPDGKLSELKNYYNDGHLYSSTRFLYTNPTTTRVELWMNKAEMGGGGRPCRAIASNT